MPQTPHHERHFTGTATVRDIVIGMADGLTVPFALAAGLSGAVHTTGIIVVAGLAEIAAGCISMGLGGYLAAQSDADHYRSELAREQREVVELPQAEVAETTDILQQYGLDRPDSELVTSRLQRRPAAWVAFMMRFELGLEAPDPRRALRSAVTIAASYLVGGLIPLSPYIALHRTSEAVPFSVAVTLLALLVFGYVKGRFTGVNPLRSGLQTALVGGLAAGAAFGLARLVA